MNFLTLFFLLFIFLSGFLCKEFLNDSVFRMELQHLLTNYSQSADSQFIEKYLSKHNYSFESCLNNGLAGRRNKTFNDLIFSLINKTITFECFHKTRSELENPFKSDFKMWLCGLVSVTIINACAALGIVFIPLMRRRYYKMVMTFMISLAVGSLAGSALLILIPDSFQLREMEATTKLEGYISYKWKGTVIFGGVYLFFLLERFLKWILNRKSKKHCFDVPENQGSMNIHRSASNKPELIGVNELEDMDKNNMQIMAHDCTEVKMELSEPKSVASVAWMIIFGDALHNFIDGLSIGASFSKNIFTGISLSIAVLCEELPHELGDFAILINAGMTVPRAVCWNLLSAATCYIGFALGMLLGELTKGTVWVFAVAGGMFLYISLVDMMPEINAVLEATSSQNASVSRLKVFVIQNIGLILGFSLILVMSLYGEHIDLGLEKQTDVW